MTTTPDTASELDLSDLEGIPTAGQTTTAPDDYGFVGFDEDGLAIYRTPATTTTTYDIPQPPATTAVTLYRSTVVILLLIVAALGVLTGVLLTHHDAPGANPSSVSVSSFNDGFSTGKQDDCQQGFAAACAWLRSN